MQINRSNYEIWLIDWQDGNLTDIQVKQLQCFLNENPDLKEEFDELNPFRLNPTGNSFSHKNNLIKTSANLSDTQFEYLSVAYLENDLSSHQQEELKEIIKHDHEKKVSFELIQKTRLHPAAHSYKNKNGLMRMTPAQKVIRLSSIMLSAAAIIIFVVISSVSKPKTLQLKTEKTAQIIVPDKSVLRPAAEKISNSLTKEKEIIVITKQSKNLVVVSHKTAASSSEISVNNQSQSDSSLSSAVLHRAIPDRISFTPDINLKGELIPNSLIAFNSTVTPFEYDEYRSRLGRFIAKTFREKILKEKAAKDSPLKVYEIAEAGVTGLDKLLGWQMALDEKKDANGELKSVYFSSRILKFTAPIKKSEPLP
jgi:hypothetical protein